MTCIVGYNDKKRKEIHIIGDSAGVSGLDITVRADKKVFTNGKFLIGFTSSYRMGQILQHTKFPKQKKEQTDFDFMCTDFIDTVMKAFDDKKYGKTISDEKHGGVFIVGYNGTLYVVHSDFQVSISHDDFDSVGCGADYALGALHAMKLLGLDIPEKLELVMDVAVICSGGVRPPYVLETIKY